MSYFSLLPPVQYYGPTAYTYAYLPSINAAFPGMPPLQCMDSCCIPVTSPFLCTGACTDTCCSGSGPDIIINNSTFSSCMDACCAGIAPDIIINNPGACVDSCCSGVMGYGFSGLYEDTCNTTSTHHYYNNSNTSRKKDGKASYDSYGKGSKMM